MRHIKQLILTIFAASILCPQALAEASYATMAQLREETKDGWHQTYEAHDRSIQVDVTIDLPEIDTVPMVQASQYTVLYPDEITDDYSKLNANEAGFFDGYIGDVLQKRVPDNAKLQQVDIYENGAYPTTQAEDNPNDFDHALAMVTQRLTALTGYQYPTDYELSLVHVTGRRYLKGKPINDMGQYSMTFRQLFAGIPLSLLSGSPHAMAAGYYDDANMHIVANYYYDSYEIKAADLSLLSFASLREIVEAEIMAGRQRSVESVALRYGAFTDGKQKNTVTLLPVWEVKGARAKDAEEEATEIHTQEGVSLYWKSVEMDVLMQDGRCYDLTDKEKNNGEFPLPSKVLTWEDVR